MKKSYWMKDRNSRNFLKRRTYRADLSRKKIASKRTGRVLLGYRATTRIKVPFALNIEAPQNRNEFLRFIQQFRDDCLGSQNRIILNFEKTEIATPAAMLLLIAEVDRAKRILGSKFLVSFTQTNNTRIRHLLGQIGFYDLCDMIAPRVDLDILEDNVRHWRFATGQRADEDTSDAFAAIEGLIGPQLRGGMWKGVSEAVINSVQHAYVQPRGVPGPRMNHRRWWMLSQETSDALTVVVCDLGIGIPRSLPLNWDESILSRIAPLVSESGPDAIALKAALTLGRTGTGKKHRGKGLPQIWSAVQGADRVEKCGIMIHSNKGKIAWSGKTGEELAKQFSSSIFGTVVMWTVPLARDEIQ